MSAAFEALKRKANISASAGFTTMQGAPSDSSSGDFESAATYGMVTLITGPIYSKGMLFACNASVNDQYAYPPVGANLTAASTAAYLVNKMRDASTMGLLGLIVGLNEVRERGVRIVEMPNKLAYTEEVTLRLADIPRKAPKVILGIRPRGR